MNLAHRTESISRLRADTERWAAVRLALGVSATGTSSSPKGTGLTDIATNTRISPDTVFWIGSITKTFTAVAGREVWEHGILLDAPGTEDLGTFRPTSPSSDPIC